MIYSLEEEEEPKGNIKKQPGKETSVSSAQGKKLKSLNGAE